jgi:triosephosphate isomerase
MRALVAGNWKMNGTLASLGELEALKQALAAPACDVLICPPATLIAQAAGRVKGAFALGGRIVTPSPRAPSPAIFPPRCCATRVRPL